ncbi:uncharacterized protein LOC143921350 [Arctopsyche grandis]|uniref:uncharacterized protein LOC143921350 n=1 Tax=Arctopsyche grandis TaxID=121162 RepID=UPI00406D6CAA
MVIELIVSNPHAPSSSPHPAHLLSADDDTGSGHEDIVVPLQTTDDISLHDTFSFSIFNMATLAPLCLYTKDLYKSRMAASTLTGQCFHILCIRPPQQRSANFASALRFVSIRDDPHPRRLDLPLGNVTICQI